MKELDILEQMLDRIGGGNARDYHSSVVPGTRYAMLVKMYDEGYTDEQIAEAINTREKRTDSTDKMTPKIANAMRMVFEGRDYLSDGPYAESRANSPTNRARSTTPTHEIIILERKNVIDLYRRGHNHAEVARISGMKFQTVTGMYYRWQFGVLISKMIMTKEGDILTDVEWCARNNCEYLLKPDFQMGG